MDLQAGCWLITASVAPLVAVLSFWSLLTFHAYRRQWRTVDLFFVALVSQEFINAVFLLGHSLLNLTKPTLTPVCSLFGWASFVVRTFQVTTVTSLVLDRAMTIKWPYRYRLSVRRNQVRYHIVVTATIAVLVGVASMFANSEEDDSTLTTWYSGQKQAGSAIRPVCFLLPFALDKKFVLFIVVLHGILILSSLIFLIHVQVKLCSSSASPASASVNHIRIAHHLPNPFLTLESPTSTTIVPSLPSTPVSNGTTWPTALHTTGRSSFSLKRGSTKLGQDFRWKVVVTIVIICNLINHIPYLVIVGLARFTILVPPLWLEGGTTYLALVEGLLLPAVLWCIDPKYRASVRQTFARFKTKTGKQPMVPFLDSEAIGDRPASRRGSLSCSTLPHLEPSSAYSSVNGFVCSDTLDKKVLLKNDSRWSTEDTKKSSYQSVSSFCSGGKPQSSPKIGSTWKSTVSIEPVYCDPTEVVLSISPPKHDTIEEHIYATLSERYASTTASDSDAKVAQKTNLIHSYNDSDDDSSSATTSASDDFEFHLTRPPVNTFRETPIKSLNYCSPNKAINNDKFKFVFDGNKDFMSVTDDYPSTTPSRASTLSIKSDHSSKDLQFMAVPLQIPIHSPTVREQHRNQLSSNGVNTLTKTQRNASLSMNDLDLLAKKQDEETEDIVYVLPGKSESTISLYRFSGGDFDETLDRPLVKCIRGRPTSSAQKPDIRSTELNCRHSLLDLLNDNQSTWESGTERGNVKKSNNTSPHTHKNNEQQFVNHAKPKNDIRTRKNLIDHPLLRKPRLYRSNAVPPNQAYNWKYRASVFPRQDFPWKKSPTRPFKMPVVSIVPGEPSSALYNYPISERHSSCSLNFTPMFNVQNAGRLSYQKKFVSDFL